MPPNRPDTNESRPQLCAIGYLVKISSARLKALSIAASAIPFFNTSNSATLNTCSASTSAIGARET